ncbi:hypothetical protein V2D85_004382 [Escherichia coli]|nr:hypothetical protein [Escherichia coli]
MAELTKEWLKQTIAEYEANRDELPFGLDTNSAIELQAFKLALASLEAKPIGAFHIAEQQVDGTSDYIKDGEWPIDNGIIEVYAAPPVPVIPDGWVMVPKELTPEMMRAVQIRSELGGYATSNLSGAYNMFSEFWNVAVSAAPKVDGL